MGSKLNSPGRYLKPGSKISKNWSPISVESLEMCLCSALPLGFSPMLYSCKQYFGIGDHLTNIMNNKWIKDDEQYIFFVF